MSTSLIYTQVLKQIKASKNATGEDLRVGTLFLNLGLEFIVAGKEIKDSKGKLIGEIDLIFADSEEDIMFLIEVSRKDKNVSQKIDHFLSKWSNESNLKILKSRYQRNEKRVYKINFDLVEKKRELSSSLNHVLDDATNRIFYKEDLEYFEEAIKAIGKWARNDLYSFLEVKPKKIKTAMPAIAYFIGEHRAFVYADHVNNILKYSYVYRRRKNDLGYQRMVQQSRIGAIAKTIKKHKTITFPNSLILNSKSVITTEIIKRDECPKYVEINIPRTYCNFRIIDGQHRLLGFAKMGDFKRDDYMLPIVLLENLDQSKEVQTFIEINHKQKKLDSNLILTIKKDFEWQLDDVEYFEKISVQIAQKLNANSELKGKIFFGYADEKRRDKITVTTLHSIFKKNNITGLKNHLYQKDVDDVETPYKKIKEVFSIIAGTFKSQNIFFFTNRGLRILFRLLQLFEKNTISGNINVGLPSLITDLHTLFKKHNLLELIEKNYGEGGAKTATEELVALLKDQFTTYENFEPDLRKV